MLANNHLFYLVVIVTSSLSFTSYTSPVFISNSSSRVWETTEYLEKNLARMTRTSCMANRCPTQFLGPAENGM